MLSRSLHPFVFALAALVPAGVVSLACSNSSSCPTPGGAASGAPDTHCVDPDSGVAIVSPTSQASCHPDGGADAAPSDYGPPVYGTAADDDDCKYHVTWSATPVCENEGVVFTVTATNAVDGTPVTGANAEAEIFLTPTHPAPTPFVTSTEGPAGTYTTQPARFDKAGRWTVRFHFFEECSDLLGDSPHGHVAFYVDVP
jgi:hypothetical protein